jgi:hypothetical protein
VVQLVRARHSTSFKMKDRILHPERVAVFMLQVPEFPDDEFEPPAASAEIDRSIDESTSASPWERRREDSR